MKKLRDIREVMKFELEKDALGIAANSVLEFMPLHIAKDYLNKDFLSEIEKGNANWNNKEYTVENVIKSINDYIDFAWEKANCNRGLSAGRSIQHFRNWFYILNEPEFDKLVKEMEDYEYYGKPWLWIISELLDIDPNELDDGFWTNGDWDDREDCYVYIPVSKQIEAIENYKARVDFENLKRKFDLIKGENNVRIN